MQAIKWEPLFVKVEDLKENPENPKIVNEAGKKKLKKSLDKFGLAGTIVCNKDLTIIDGHSRKKELIENQITHVWVSVPDRQLSKKEYKEFNAIIDIAKAGDINLELMNQVFPETFFKEWDIDKETEGKTVKFKVKDKSKDEKKRFIIEVECKDEEEQVKLFNEFKEAGHRCNITTI